MLNKWKLPPKLINLTAIQKQYLFDRKHRFIILPAGRRSRKTLLGKHKVICDYALEKPYQNFFLGAPTHDQAKNIFWKDLKRYTSYFRYGKSETELKVILKNNTMIRVVGLDKAERLEGVEWHGCFITEMPNIKEHVWKENVRPMLSDTKGFALLDGVPEGLNFYHDMALRACDGVIPKTEPIKGAFHESREFSEWAYYRWFSSDVLDANEIKLAKLEYDERTFRQEYMGSFESYEGLAYWAFSKDNLKTIKYNKGEYVHIGMDFNVNPMTATFNHVRSNDIFQFGEAYLNNSNTYEMVNHIKELFQINLCLIYPDSTGKRSTSNATVSDIAILKQNGFKIIARNSNPPQKDRINAVNSKLRAGDGKAHYFIDSKNCQKTINDLNKVESLADGRLNKTQETSGLVHITDAQGYLIHYLFPIRKFEARTFAK